jgi:hypothetical protein
LREELARLLSGDWNLHVGTTDAILALPGIQRLIAAEEAVRRVRKLADRLKRGGQHVPEVDLIYRALDDR